MDYNKYLNDDNLDKLGLINKIDTYEIINREFQRKREVKNTIILISSVIVIILLVFCIFNVVNIINVKKIIDIRWLIKTLGVYHIISSWMLMIILLPILKKKRVKAN